MRNWVIAIVVIIAIALCGGYYYGTRQYKAGYDAGYKIGYDDGYKNANALKQKEIADAVATHSRTETKIVYQKIPYNGNDVQIKTEPPKVTVSVNGKQQEIQQKTETADLAVKTETAVAIKIPERKTSIGIGVDNDKKPAYMLKHNINGATGIWIAGSKHKFMGGVSISF